VLSGAGGSLWCEKLAPGPPHLRSAADGTGAFVEGSPGVGLELFQPAPVLPEAAVLPLAALVELALVLLADVLLAASSPPEPAPPPPPAPPVSSPQPAAASAPAKTIEARTIRTMFMKSGSL